MTFHLRSVLLAIFLLAGEAHATQQDDLQKLRKRIAALEQDFEKTSESKSEAADGLRESERAISNSNRKLHDLAQQQQIAGSELGQLQQRAAAMDKELQGQQAMLGRLLYQQYLDGGEQEYLKLLLNNDDPNQVARELRYYEYIARNRAAALKSLRAVVGKIANCDRSGTRKKATRSAHCVQKSNLNGNVWNRTTRTPTDIEQDRSANETATARDWTLAAQRKSFFAIG